MEISKKNMIIIVLAVIVLVLFVRKIFKTGSSNTISNFDNVSDTPKFVNFNASWCYWSKKLNPTWENLKDDMSNKNIEILDIKCDMEENKDLCERYGIDGYPSIRLIQGNKIYSYDGDRSLDDMKDFINEFVSY
jgi:thiol-disulfide isomerase/thioredoxin